MFTSAYFQLIPSQLNSRDDLYKEMSLYAAHCTQAVVTFPTPLLLSLAYSDLISPVFTLGFAGVRWFPSCARQRWNGWVIGVVPPGRWEKNHPSGDGGGGSEIDGDDGDWQGDPQLAVNGSPFVLMLVCNEDLISLESCEQEAIFNTNASRSQDRCQPKRAFLHCQVTMKGFAGVRWFPSCARQRWNGWVIGVVPPGRWEKNHPSGDGGGGG
ncbi:hypothetical protein Dimus_029461 [Dionaea muscipula]